MNTTYNRTISTLNETIAATLDFQTYKNAFDAFLATPPISDVVNIIDNISQKIKLLARQVFSQFQRSVLNARFPNTITTINTIATNIEKIFNIMETLPFIGIMSSELRVNAGKLQVVAGALLSAFAEVGHLMAYQHGGTKSKLERWQLLSKMGTEHIQHGCLNILRGTAGLLCGSTLFGMGSIFLVIPNMINHRNFAPYFPYGSIVKLDR